MPSNRPGSAQSQTPAPVEATESDVTTRRFFSNASGRRVNTACVVLETLHYQYPDLHIVILPRIRMQPTRLRRGELRTSRAPRQRGSAVPESLKSKIYVPSPRRPMTRKGASSRGWTGGDLPTNGAMTSSSCTWPTGGTACRRIPRFATFTCSRGEGEGGGVDYGGGEVE